MPPRAVKLSTALRITLALLIIYLPHTLLAIRTVHLDHSWILFKLLPILPGFAIHGLIGAMRIFGPLHNWFVTSMLTALWIAGVLVGFLRMQRAFWPFLAAAALFSTLLGWIILQMLKA